ncbi:protein CHLOROPLAST IMPORT APPARATUS 2-like isoform X1 [Coffea eugenioides]|uniref:protein CHLOROPLAST IMPORT APPARATUS 2-like isoform X1 n=1 Tax=Coffea eugenioides TaxID=49369 RepID=UPI000F61128A|nr:protein CHLOROPLAST IMPORT APPARATUS 2-like isoform X1 [Coffea eugenioides]XP_027176691.1 protein CHLOROPLAST IMPORT APPARATUS 2-like isoform X1 [Coffea eugenioides]
MSSCLSGGGRAYRLHLEIIKSPTTSWTSQSSSPSSTLSESSNSPIAISTRKPRTPRKRPNQTYNEAAALLSTAYPKIFSTKHLTKPCKFTKQQYPFSYEPSDLLLPFPVIDNSSFLIHHPPVLEKPNSYPIEQKMASSCEKPCQSPGEINSKMNFSEVSDDFNEDFDAESILDEEIEQGIDSIMGNLGVENEAVDESNTFCYGTNTSQIGTCYGYPVGLGFGVNSEYGNFGMRNNHIRAFRNSDEGDWWFPIVNVRDITPRFHKPPAEKKKKKVEKTVELKNLAEPSSVTAKETLISSSSARAMKQNSGPAQKLAKDKVKDKDKDKEEEEEPNEPKPNVGSLLLKLNYDNVLTAWSDGPSPFADDSPVAEASGNDLQARLAKIDLFSETGGVREASVLRYKEKRRTRLFSKKIRYQVRKVNADRRPRMKGRFVRTPNSPDSEQG